jgi:hypothetical protein
MYNILKRPMFKLGGQADQGSGIMSYVEPRQNYMFGNIVQPLTPFQTAYSDLQVQGYATGGRIGYQKAGPVNPVLPGTLPTVKSAYPTYGREQLIESMYGKENIQNAYQNEIEKYKQNIKNLQNRSGMLSEDPESGVFIPNIEADISRIESGLATLQSPEGKRAFEAKKIAELNKTRKQEGLASLVPTEEAKVGGNEGDGSKKPDFEETKKTNPKEDIKAEAEMLKGLLRNEGLTTAENALIIAKALGTPGGINAKIAAAGDLALPILRERAKLDKEATLEAYKTSKEIQKSKIAAGTLSAQQKLIESEIQNQKSLSKQITRDPNGTIRYDGLTEAEIRDRVQAPIFGKYTSKEAFEKEQRVIKLEKDILAESIKPKPDLAQIKKWKDEAEILRKYYKFKANGGRINKAVGGMSMEDTTVEDTTGEKTETVVDTNVDGFPMKPVQKLSFEEIRSRLPKEITDDIVKLISNSSEALQDFAYIKTQQDVNQFNVKYGVNLVLPQNV